LDLYSASDYLPTTLTDPVKGPSYDVAQTAFQSAVGTTKPRWDWLKEEILEGSRRPVSVGYPRSGSTASNEHSDSEAAVQKNGHTNENGIVTSHTQPRPELEIFGMAMLGGGKVFGSAHVFDYPWNELGSGTVVDVGGGVGMMILLHSSMTI